MTCRTPISPLTTEIILDFLKIMFSNSLHMFPQRLIRGFVMETISFCCSPKAENFIQAFLMPHFKERWILQGDTLDQTAVYCTIVACQFCPDVQYLILSLHISLRS